MVFVVRGFAGALDYPPVVAGPPVTRVSSQGTPSTQNATFIACGEHARKAGSRMSEIVAAINEVWSAHVRVYQSVAVMPPHASSGGCVLYNPVYLNALLHQLMIQDRGVADAMVYAIMAHEVGHELHSDFSPERAGMSTQTKELEADRFAGYTLERLNIGLDNITPYYSLAGDEFSGGQTQAASRHGDSMRRTAALKRGWDSAEWNQPEDYRSLSDDDQP